MPQAGLTMKGLYPLVFQVNSTVGFPTAGPQNVSQDVVTPDLIDNAIKSFKQRFVRGPAVRMPRFSTTQFIRGGTANDVFLSSDASVVSNLRDDFSSYVGLIVLPPAKLNQLYYRLKITWTVEFSECRSMTDILNWRSLANLGEVAYGTDYATQSKAMSTLEGMADTSGADIKKIMEGGS